MSHGPVFDTYLQVRLTTHDKERIKARAKASGEKSTSEYVRKRALGQHSGTYRTPGLGIEKRSMYEAARRLNLEEAKASVALDGETMYEGHPAVVASKRQAPRNEP